MEAGGIDGLELLENWKEGEGRKRGAGKGVNPDNEGDFREEDEEDRIVLDMVEDMDSDDSVAGSKSRAKVLTSTSVIATRTRRSPAKRMEQKRRAGQGLT